MSMQIVLRKHYVVKLGNSAMPMLDLGQEQNQGESKGPIRWRNRV
ncbi:hypothetical protein SAMN05216404_1157 [Nitrosospira multiformis]|uniref:Uncharacterized protein n=1 Tax=Nitrosospira multiformis TaxID=1231 RepID=A0A1H8N358_9PROT|nr:hypothetical protein SAMN05216404_1157 [Nitrosospira multiformis]